MIKQQGDQIKQQGDQIKQQGDQIKQQGDQIKQQGDQIKQQGDQIKQQGDQIKQQGDQIKQDRVQIKQLEEQIKTLMKFNKLVPPPVDIVMDEFRQHKREDDDWYSPLFYSHLGGYKMCLNVCANGDGDGEGTHVSVFVCLMRGEFDDDLKWPFSGKITVQLKRTSCLLRRWQNEPKNVQKIISLNDADDDALRRPTTEMNAARGYDFISHLDLYAGKYLMNDKLTFCISDITVLSK